MNEIFHRTSIRKYEQKPVEADKVKLILRAAMAAPSAGNQQPWEFYVVTDPAVKTALSETSPFAGPAAEAPLVFVVCTRKNCRMPEYASIDASAAIENMLLEIDSLGLGGVWLGIAPLQKRMDAVAEVLQLPENLQAHSLIACGHPQEARSQQDRYDSTRVHLI